MSKLLSVKHKELKKRVSFRLKESTAIELDALKKRVKEAGNNVQLKLDDVIDSELKTRIKKANEMLDSLESRTHNG